MRTTLTLDEDVATRLKAEARKTGKPLKAIVNETLRDGLVSRRPGKKLPPFRVKARPMGLRPGLNYDCISALLEYLDEPNDR